jgi:hypothetical protein
MKHILFVIPAFFMAASALASTSYTLDLKPEPLPSKKIELRFTETQISARKCPILVESFELTPPSRARDGQIDIKTESNGPRLICPAVMGKRSGRIELDSRTLKSGKYRVFVDGVSAGTFAYVRPLAARPAR